MAGHSTTNSLRWRKRADEPNDLTVKSITAHLQGVAVDDGIEEYDADETTHTAEAQILRLARARHLQIMEAAALAIIDQLKRPPGCLIIKPSCWNIHGQDLHAVETEASGVTSHDILSLRRMIKTTAIPDGLTICRKFAQRAIPVNCEACMLNKKIKRLASLATFSLC